MEIIFLGEGEWQIGSWSPPNGERMKRAHELLTTQFVKPDSEQSRAVITTAKAALQGFRPITRFEAWELRCGKALQEFRLADYLYRVDREQAYKGAEKAALLELTDEQKEKRREECMYRAKDLYNRKMYFI